MQMIKAVHFGQADEEKVQKYLDVCLPLYNPTPGDADAAARGHRPDPTEDKKVQKVSGGDGLGDAQRQRRYLMAYY